MSSEPESSSSRWQDSLDPVSLLYWAGPEKSEPLEPTRDAWPSSSHYVPLDIPGQPSEPIPTNNEIGGPPWLVAPWSLGVCLGFLFLIGDRALALTLAVLSVALWAAGYWAWRRFRRSH